MCLCEQITSVSLSQCVWFTGHTEVLWNVNHCLGMQESPFFTKWKLNIFNLQVFSYSPKWNFPPRRFIFHPKAKTSKEEIAVRFEGGLCLIARSVTNDNASAAFKDPSPFLALNPQNHLHAILLNFTCHSGISFSGWSMNTVCSCSGKLFPHLKPHWQKLVLEEIECEWKADGIEIELRP